MHNRQKSPRKREKSSRKLHLKETKSEEKSKRVRWLGEKAML
jgi:hypothetical protein